MLAVQERPAIVTSFTYSRFGFKVRRGLGIQASCCEGWVWGARPAGLWLTVVGVRV